MLLAAGSATLTASPAGASTYGNFTFNAGSTLGVTTTEFLSGPSVSGHTSPGTPAAETTTIRLNAPRTSIVMDGFRLGAEDTLNLVFSSATDIVFFNAIGSSPAVVAGTINTFVGAVDGPRGGNVWLGGISGLSFASTADVEVGGLLATTHRSDSTKFLSGTYEWLDPFFGVPPVTLATGASITGHGGLLAFIGPTVHQVAGSVVGGAPGSGTEVLFASAQSATMRLGAGSTGLELLAFSSTPAFMDGGEGPILAGTTRAPDVYVSGSGTSFRSISLTGSIEATGAPAGNSGDVVVAAGHPLSRASGADPLLTGTTGFGSFIQAAGAVTATRRIVMASASSISLLAGARLTSPDVVLSARDSVGNGVGSAAVDVGAGGRWVVYADSADRFSQPASAPDTLDSGNPAVWGADLASAPPSSLTGNRYVFRQPPTVTFTAADVQKPYGTELTSFDVGVSGAHLGKPGLFTADEVQGYTGAPAVTSDGGAPTARVLRTGPYPITVTNGSLVSASGYRFAFVNGKLTVLDSTPADVTPTVTGARSESGWYTGDVTVDWSVVEPQSYTDPEDCPDVTVTADQPETVHSCSVTGPGGGATGTVTIGRDATAPTLTVEGLRGTAAYTPGTWADGDVAITYTCSDATSGVATQTVDTVATVSGDYAGTCTDRAGNTTTVPFRVDIDNAAPVLGPMPENLSLTTTGDTATATWTDPTATDGQDTAVAVACDPPSGSSFPVGTTTVTCTATDLAGNTDTGTFTVTVAVGQDAAPPVRIRLRAPIDAPPALNTAVHARTVPVRVSVVRTPGSAAVAPLHAGTPQPVACTVTRRSDAVEFYTSRPAQVTNLFVWDPVKRNWLYRLDPRMLGLTKGTCYRVAVRSGGTVERRIADGGTEIGYFYLRTR